MKTEPEVLKRFCEWYRNRDGSNALVWWKIGFDANGNVKPFFDRSIRRLERNIEALARLDWNKKYSDALIALDDVYEMANNFLRSIRIGKK